MEYRDITAAGIFSPPQWEFYATEKIFQCLINCYCVAIFLGVFLIGIFANNLKSARLAEGLLLLAAALFWCAVGFILKLTLQSTLGIFWIVFLIITLGGSIFSIYKSRKI